MPGRYSYGRKYYRRAGYKTGIKGSGTYGVSYNRYMNPNRSLRGGSKGVTFIHREMIMNVTASTAFNKVDFLIQPADKITFPWLSSVAPLFEQWAPRSIKFEFKSTSGDAISSTNTALGRVITTTEYNINSPTFTSAAQMYNHERTKTTKPSLNVVHKVYCRPSTIPTYPLYTRTSQGSAATSSTAGDNRFCDLARFTIATEGMQNVGGIIGQLWISYKITFLKKQVALADTYAYNDLYTMVPYSSSTALNAQVYQGATGANQFQFGYGVQNLPLGNGSYTSTGGNSRGGQANMELADYSNAGTWLTTSDDSKAATATSGNRIVFYGSADVTNYLITLRLCGNQFTDNTAGSVLSVNNCTNNGINLSPGSLVTQISTWSNNQQLSPVGNIINRLGAPAETALGLIPIYASSACTFISMFVVRVAATPAYNYSQALAAGAYLDFNLQTTTNQLYFGGGNQLMISVLTDDVVTNNPITPTVTDSRVKVLRKRFGLSAVDNKTRDAILKVIPQTLPPGPLTMAQESKHYASLLDHDEDSEGLAVLDDDSDDDGLIGIEGKDHPFPERERKEPPPSVVPLTRTASVVRGVKRSKENDNLQQAKLRRADAVAGSATPTRPG
jgi:hypothetical protein